MIHIFLPIYNEEKIVAKNTEEVYRTTKKLNEPFKIILVNDNSNDGTTAIAFTATVTSISLRLLDPPGGTLPAQKPLDSCHTG
jgi:hypothetical protein